MTPFGLFYVVGVTILFFFWVCGIAAFARDLRDTYAPAVRGYLSARCEWAEQAKRKTDREENERQPY